VLAEQLKLKVGVQFFNQLHQPVAVVEMNVLVAVDREVQAAEQED